MEDRPLRVGDRVEWTGPSEGPVGGGPQHGERGWLIMVDPADDIIMFDVCGHQTANYIHSPDFRRVRNEADPEKWLPGDPFGPATAPFDEKDIQTVRRWLKEEVAVRVDCVRFGGGAGDWYLVRDYDSFEDLVLTKREPFPRARLPCSTSTAALTSRCGESSTSPSSAGRRLRSLTQATSGSSTRGRSIPTGSNFMKSRIRLRRLGRYSGD